MKSRTMKLSDYVFTALADAGVRHVFLLTGGGAMHLNDSIAGEPRIQHICNHHEQAAAMAGEGYARVCGRPAVVCVTSGPGGINALNGVFGAWTDSVPMLIVSGQVKRETCMAALGIRGLRQLGDQEVDIVRMASGITKYAALVTEPDSIRYHLERALYLTSSGRPGPCWLDIPIDVQSSTVEPATLPAFDPATETPVWDQNLLQAQCSHVLDRLDQVKRPVLLAGTGVRAANAVDEFECTARQLGIPVTTAWTHDLISSDDPLFCGRPGTIGERAGNFAVQNADLLLVLGSRLNIRQVGYKRNSFARNAEIIQVDIDPAELSKPTIHPDLVIQSDLKAFLTQLLDRMGERHWEPGRHVEWLAWCRARVNRYPVVQEKHRQLGLRVNPYHFVEMLFENLAENDVVVCGNASACIVPFQAARLKRGQRMFSNSGSASMGYGLPAAIGAAVARPDQRVICVEGDGSLQLNIQELQTVAHHQLPIKIFVLKNGGYLSIRTTQRTFFNRFLGESPASGVSFPDYGAVGRAYGIQTQTIQNCSDFARIAEVLDTRGPVLCEVSVDPEQEFEPRLRSRTQPDGAIVSPEIEDMYPFLSCEEMRENLWPGEHP